MITGAWSVIFHGRPRASHDIDVVVEMKEHDAQKIIVHLKALPLELFLQEEAIMDAVKEKHMFNVYHFASNTKVDFFMLQDTT
jgi:hypothetical protein